MSLLIEYYDSSAGLNLYAILMRNDSAAYKPSTTSFVSYTDATITNFNLNLTEDVNRGKYYTYSITGVTIDSDVYTVEIYRRLGGSPNKSADILKAAGPLYWTGSGAIENIFSPRINDGAFIGSPTLGDILTFHFNTFDKFGNVKDTDESITCSIWDGASILDSITPTHMSEGWYYVDIPIDSGVYTEGKTYQIELRSDLNCVAINSNRTFQIYNSAAISSNIDVADQLAYASGFILTSTSTSGYTTTLSSSQNDHYNGSIMRVRTGTLRSEARIIRDYIGSTKFIQTNKGFTSPLTSGTEFLVYPIGGELGQI